MGCNSVKDAKQQFLRLVKNIGLETDINKLKYELAKGYHEIAEAAKYENINEIVSEIKERVKKYPALLDAFPNIEQAFSRGFNPEKVMMVKNEETSDEEVNDELNARKAAVLNSVYKKYFFNAVSPKMYFERGLQTKLVNNFFIDRINDKIISTEEELNRSIIELKQNLIDSLYDYITNTLKRSLNVHPNITTQEGDVFTFLTEVEAEIGPNTWNQELLNNYYKEFKDKKNKAKQAKLDAYNDFIFLKNFDFFVSSKIGDLIEINSERKGLYTADLDTYRFTLKATNMWGNQLGDEVKDVSDIVSTVSQLLIKSLRLYTWKSGNEMPDRYLTFADYNTTIGKLKDLSSRKLATSQLDLTTYDNLSSLATRVINSISKLNQEREGRSDVLIQELVDLIDENPIEILPTIFEVLCETDIMDDLMNDVNSEAIFNNYDKNIIWSLYKELFSNHEHSIFNITKKEHKLKVYEYLTLTANSMYQEKFIQYYRDYNGKLRTRFLDSFAINLVQRNLLTTLTLSGTITNRVQFDNKIGRYIIPESVRRQDVPIDNYGSKSLLTQLTYKVGDINVVVTADKYTPTYSPNTDFLKVWESKEFRDFAKNTIGLYLDLDPDFNDAFWNVHGKNYLAMVNNIFEIASEVIFIQYFNNVILTDSNNAFGGKSAIELEAIIEALFQADLFRPNIATNGDFKAQVFPKSQIDKLYAIAFARCINNGLLVASLVKTGEKTALATHTTSRLRNSRFHQFMRQNRNLSSATRNFTIIKNQNGFFKGLHTRREYTDGNTTKPITKFTASESFQMSFLYDFITGFSKADKNKYDVFKNGTCGFMPTVNSDKTLIDLLTVDINAESTHHPGKTYAELTVEELNQEISSELFKAYDTILANTANVFQRILAAKGITTYNVGDSLQNAIHQMLEINNQARLSGKTAELYMEEATLLWNNIHSHNKIAIGEQMHYVKNDDGSIGLNKSTVALWARFNPNGITDPNIYKLYKVEADLKDTNGNILKRGVDERFAATCDGFFKLKDFETLQSLLRSKFSVSLFGSDVDPDQPELAFLREFQNGKWVGENGKMILAKYKDINGKYHDITSVELLENPQLGLHALNVEIHPMLSKYNRMDYLVSQLFTLATVGSHVIHKGKGKRDVLLEEAKRWLASNKRNNALTATVHKFQANTLQGIGNKYNIAIIRDIEVPVYNAMGISDRHKALDGGMFVNIWTSYLENYSLGSEAAGIDKKIFGTFYMEDFAAGGQIKTAGFACTNDRMRNFPHWAIIQKNMSDRRWIAQETNPDGTNIYETIDLSNWLGVDKIKGTEWDSVYYERELSDGKCYPMKFCGLVSLGNNKYNILEQRVLLNGDAITEPTLRVDQDGNPAEITIDTNWKLFTEVFGGYNSLSVKDDGLLNFSEQSNKFMVKAINTIGYQTIDGLKIWEQGNALTQKDFYQPMKYSDVLYCANEGAIKSAGCNLNSSDLLYNEGALNTFTILTSQIGIQLDKEHSVDEARVSMPTQITSACSNRGFTLQNSKQLYTALRGLTESVLEPWKKGINNLLSQEGDTDGILTTMVVDTVVSDLIQESEDIGALLTAFEELMNKKRRGETIKYEDINGKIAFSEGTIYNQIFSKLSSHMAKAGILLKMAGTLSVICPTAGLMQLYGDYKRGSFQKLDANGAIPIERQLRAIQDQINGYTIDEQGNKVIIDTPTELLKYVIFKSGINAFSIEQQLDAVSKVKMQHNYLVTITSPAGIISTIRTSLLTKKDYDNLQAWVANGYLLENTYDENGNIVTAKVTSVVEDILTPRDLAAYDIKFSAKNKVLGKRNEFCLFDIDSVNYLYDLEEGKLSLDYIKNNPVLSRVLETHKSITTNKKILGIREYLAKKGINIDDASSFEANRPIIHKLCRSILYKEFLNDMFALSEEYEGNRRISIGGEYVYIDPNSIDIRPYELIMSKLDATKFGINEFDDLQEILADKEFFTKRHLSKLVGCKLSNKCYDWELKRYNGDHLYVLSKEHFEQIPELYKNLFKDFTWNKLNIEGSLERVDDDGKTIYKLSSTEDMIKKFAGIEVIITDHPEFYIENLQYDILKPNAEIDQERFVNLLSALHFSNQAIKDFISDVTYQDEETNLTNIDNMDDIRARSQALDEMTLQNIYDDSSTLHPVVRNLINTIKRNGHEIHTSFDLSLNIIAGRIPAQSQQSFMIQRVVAFDNPNINSAYVQTALLWLLGSDLDIDAVTLIGSEFTNSGKYIMWSPYCRIDTIENLKASLRIPFPTNTKIDLQINKDNPNWFTNYISLITECLKVSKDGTRFIVQTYDPNNIKAFARLISRINEEGISLLDDIENLRQSFEESTAAKNMFDYKNLEKLTQSLIDIVNKHNLYLTKKSKKYKEAALKNLAQYRMYKTAESPSNLAEGTESIDISTKLLKELAASSALAKEDAKAAPGISWMKHSQIVQGQVGKDCVSISAVAIKINSATQYYLDITINEGSPENQIHMIVDPKRINGKTYKTFANIYDKSTQFSPDGSSLNANEQIRNIVNEVLLNLGFEEDVAINLAALLSISVDKN